MRSNYVVWYPSQASLSWYPLIAPPDSSHGFVVSSMKYERNLGSMTGSNAQFSFVWHKPDAVPKYNLMFSTNVPAPWSESVVLIPFAEHLLFVSLDSTFI